MGLSRVCSVILVLWLDVIGVVGYGWLVWSFAYQFVWLVLLFLLLLPPTPSTTTRLLVLLLLLTATATTYHYDFFLLPTTAFTYS